MKNQFNSIATLIFCIWVTSYSFTQSSCNNIGFEEGNTSGFNLFFGVIQEDHSIEIHQGTLDDQHEIQSKNIGNDSVAYLHCIVNKELPVVGLGLGQHSLRLGNEDGGKYVAKITRDMLVTPENNFLILNYAVILEDPSHQIFEQPQFSLTIKDENGNNLNCGEYLVTSGPDIDGFENCGDWRVRPWTSAGFELQSYLGQNIELEITTLDCSKGAHGGYAYIDLNCKPLEIILDNYCEGETEAYLTVTDGFEAYAWNTGANTNSITITNPIPGEEFSVEVTSATGCTITLRDTLPDFETFPTPNLTPVNDTTICEGEFYYYIPQGENLERVENIATGEIDDIFFIDAEESTQYRFVGKNEYGCDSDTISFEVKVNAKPWIIAAEVFACDESDNATLTIYTDILEGCLYSIDGINYQSSNQFDDLESGPLVVYAKSTENCIDSLSVEIEFFNSVEIISYNIIDNDCDIPGLIDITLLAEETPYTVWCNWHEYSNKDWFSPLTGGEYHIVFENVFGCKDSIDLVVGENQKPIVDSVNMVPFSCGPIGGIIEVFATDLESSVRYSLDGINFQSDGYFENVEPGVHIIHVIDEEDCLVTTNIFVDEIPAAITLSIKEKNDPSCELANGSIILEAELGFPKYEYSLSGSDFISDPIFENLPQGLYQAIVKDDYDCVDTLYFELQNSNNPATEILSIESSGCDDDNGIIHVQGLGGTPPLTYQINSELIQESGLFENVPTGLHQIFAIDQLGCKDSIEVYIKDGCDLFIPNVITHYSDDMNGKFYIQTPNNSQVLIQELIIYDRWGNAVYQVQDLNPRDPNDRWWDGSFNGVNVVSGVYTYIIYYADLGEELSILTGSLTVL